MKTRKPTGEVGFPNLIIEGRESTWKTSTCLKFTADPRVGAAYVVEVGERRADEYAALGNFEIVEHGGKVNQVVEGIRGVMAEPPRDDRPNVLIVDSGTGLWDLVKREAERIARSSNAARTKLEQDPNAEIDVGHQAWNKAKDRYWWSWLNELRAWPGIALITCRADEVSKFQDGRPVAGQTDYRLEIESGTRYIVDGVVRMRGARGPLLVSAKSLKFVVPDEGLDLPPEEPLSHLLFDLFQCGTSVTLTLAQAKQAVVAGARSIGWHDADAVRVAADVWKAHAANATEYGGDLMRTMLDALPRPQTEDPQGKAAGGPESQVAPGQPADGERSAPPADPAEQAAADAAPAAGRDPAEGVQCALCGSTRAKTTVVDGVTRCMVVSACEDRQAKAAAKAAQEATTAATVAQDGAEQPEVTEGAGEPPAATQPEDPDAKRGALEAAACEHVSRLSKLSIVSELASHGVIADVRKGDTELGSQLVDVIVAVGMGEPVPGAKPVDTHVGDSVAEQQALA